MKTLSKKFHSHSLLCIVCICMSVGKCDSFAQGKTTMVFRDYLTEIGNRFDCYFTVESVGQPQSLNNPILDAMVDVDTARPRDVNDVVAFLTNGVTIVWKTETETRQINLVLDMGKNTGRRTIIRLRDRRLLDTEDYALVKKVSLEYNGNPFGLLTALSSKGLLVEPESVVSVGMGEIEVDAQTQVRVMVQDKVIRDLLTECIPLPGYNRVIWSSYTDGKQKSPSVTVTFYGMRSK